MSDQIDPAFKAAWRESQGQPVDAEPRRPIVAAQQDGGLVDRLHTLAVYMDRSQHEKWCKSKTVPVHGYSSEGVLLREAATALAEKDARRVALEAELEASRFAERNGKSLAEDSIHAIRELLKAHDVPVAAFIDDHVGNAIAQRDEARAECEGLRAERDEARKKLSACRWYWPEDDTSSDCCGESAQEIVQNAYDWSSKNAGGVIAVARGGIVEVTYCASLPPADDADSDDDFWVEEATREAAQAKIDAEKARRAAPSRKEPGNAT